MPRTIGPLAAILLTLVAAAAAHAAGTAPLKIVDGDTVRLSGVAIRIANIDAPEIGKAQCDAERRLGLAAKRRLGELLAVGRIEVRVQQGRSIDRYGRTLARLAVAGRDVGDVLVEEGLARPWEGRRRPWCLAP